MSTNQQAGVPRCPKLGGGQGEGYTQASVHLPGRSKWLAGGVSSPGGLDFLWRERVAFALLPVCESSCVVQETEGGSRRDGLATGIYEVPQVKHDVFGVDHSRVAWKLRFCQDPEVERVPAALDGRGRRRCSCRQGVDVRGVAYSIHSARGGRGSRGRDLVAADGRRRICHREVPLPCLLGQLSCSVHGELLDVCPVLGPSFSNAYLIRMFAKSLIYIRWLDARYPGTVADDATGEQCSGDDDKDGSKDWSTLEVRAAHCTERQT